MDCWVFSLCVLIKILFRPVQTETIDETTQNAKPTGFIIPEELSDDQDLFVFERNLEYIVSSKSLRWEEALLACKTQLSRPALLAMVDTEKKALFLSEALAETNKVFDNLWIAGVKKHNVWTEGFKDRRLPVDLLRKYNQTIPDYNVTSIKDCLAFRRSFHLKPGFVQLNCFAERPYICERSYVVDEMTAGNATHPGWIKLGKRLYKIFHDRTTWENATEKCYKSDRRARLAVIANYADAQNLGRYLLVGRPALENAWIGAKYDFIKQQFVFDTEKIELSNVKDNSTNYPPWLEDSIRKKDGCLLLDRHLGNTTLFIEARCGRLRPYICYKIDERDEKIEHQNQFVFDNADYIFYFNRSNFETAIRRCSTKPFPSAKAAGKLATPKNILEVSHLLSIMGENVSTSQHVWIGGKMFKNKWSWLKPREILDGRDEPEEEIPIFSTDGYPPWVINGSYTEDVENMNVCLNMDRENHKIALFYGTDCSYPQNFICEYPKGTLTDTTEETTITDNTESTEITDSTGTSESTKTKEDVETTESAETQTTEDVEKTETEEDILTTTEDTEATIEDTEATIEDTEATTEDTEATTEIVENTETTENTETIEEITLDTEMTEDFKTTEDDGDAKTTENPYD